jgi:hypothetical protein
MSKPNSKPEEKVPALATVAGVPAGIAELAKTRAGQGVSKAAQDNLVPLIYVLQGLSPQTDRRKPEYIEGAEAGAFWLRNSSVPIISGETGFVFQPCWYQKGWLEWLPRDEGGGGGGGFAGRWENIEKGSEDVPECPDARFEADERTGQKSWTRPNGNDLILVREHAGFVIHPDRPPEPFIVPFTSTGHTASRKWMSKIKGKLLPDGSDAYPAYCFLYRLKTVYRKNSFGEWYMIDVDDVGPIESDVDFHRGAALFDAFNKGEKVAEAPQEAAPREDVSQGGAI